MSVQWPFEFLGFQPEPGRADKDVYFFHAHNRVIKIKSTVMNTPGTEGCLMDIAPLRFWQVVFPNGRKGVDWRKAKAWIKHKQYGIGWYRDPDEGIVIHKDLTARSAAQK